MDEIIKTEENITKKKKVSYSQFSNWFNCPHRWWLDNVKKFKKFEDSVNTCFGTAIHEVVQLYVQTLYTKSSKEANEIEMYDLFKIAFKRELELAKENSKKGKITDHNKDEIVEDEKIEVKLFDYTNEQFEEFCQDGNDILDAFLNMTNRMKYFPSSKYEFLSVEDEIIMPIKNNVEFICYIDLVLKEKNTGRIRIIDIKTSTQGWNNYQKEDPVKTSQVLLYKAFYSRKYSIPMNMIDVEFFILRRRLWEGVSFPQSRIQVFTPKNDQKEVAKAVNVFADFVTDCFDKDGTYNKDDKKFYKNPGKNKKHCRWCPHKKINCDAKSDIPKEELE